MFKEVKQMNIQSILKENAFMEVIEWLPSGVEDIVQSINEEQLLEIESI